VLPFTPHGGQLPLVPGGQPNAEPEISAGAVTIPIHPPDGSRCGVGGGCGGRGGLEGTVRGLQPAAGSGGGVRREAPHPRDSGDRRPV